MNSPDILHQNIPDDIPDTSFNFGLAEQDKVCYPNYVYTNLNVVFESEPRVKRTQKIANFAISTSENTPQNKRLKLSDDDEEDKENLDPERYLVN